MELSTEMIVAAGGAVYLIDRLISGFKARGIDLQKMTRQLDELHDWHDKEDNDGVKIWYVRHSLEEVISQLADNVSKQSDLLTSLVHEMKEIRRDVDSAKHDR